MLFVIDITFMYSNLKPGGLEIVVEKRHFSSHTGASQ